MHEDYDDYANQALEAGMQTADIDRLRGYTDKDAETASTMLFCITGGVLIVMGCVIGYLIKGGVS
jgi:hypothetical protein